ncbi:MAG: chromosome segregation protein ScpA [Nitrososphaeraceae archaeon]
MIEERNSKSSLALPPLNLLFNTSLLGKRNVWEINISRLLELLLNIINSSGKKDLRICGIAAWSSTLIYRLKVESIFQLDKLSMEKKIYDGSNEKEIPHLKLIDFPFRLSSTYPVSLEDLLTILENIISSLNNPSMKNRNLVELEPVEIFDLDHYLIKFEKILEEKEEFIMHSLRLTDSILFSKLIENCDRLEVARIFIALLHLAMKGKIDLVELDKSFDIEIRRLKV